jgi:hypothetical protein
LAFIAALQRSLGDAFIADRCLAGHFRGSSMPRYNRNAATAYREAQLDSNTDYIGTGCNGQEWKMDDVCPLLLANARHSSP